MKATKDPEQPTAAESRIAGRSRRIKCLWHWLLSPWTWRMAWRDTRTSRGRLLLFSSSMVLGVAALAAIGSLGKNLERAVEEQARTLLGADLAIASRRAFTAEEESWIQEIGGEQSRETSFSSMIYFPASGGTRLVQVRALSGGFPFYGRRRAGWAGVWRDWPSPRIPRRPSRAVGAPCRRCRCRS